MTLKRLAIAALLFLTSISLFSQNPFKKIEVVYYTTDNSEHKIDIEFQCEITNTGVFNMIGSWRGGEDTYQTYTVKDTLKNKIVQFFSGDKKMKSYMVKKGMDEGMHYAGSYIYICVTKANGVKDELCFITNLMSSDFNNLYTEIEAVFFPRNKKYVSTKPNITPITLKRVEEEHKKSNYLPSIEQPPPMD